MTSYRQAGKYIIFFFFLFPNSAFSRLTFSSLSLFEQLTINGLLLVY